MARNSYDMDDNMKSSESETYDKTKNQSRNSQNERHGQCQYFLSHFFTSLLVIMCVRISL